MLNDWLGDFYEKGQFENLQMCLLVLNKLIKNIANKLGYENLFLLIY